MDWIPVLFGGLAGGVIAVVVQFLLTNVREKAVLELRCRNVLLALHAEIGDNVRRIRESPLLPAPVIPFEEPVTAYLAGGPIFEWVPDYTVMRAFNEAIRARRYIEEAWQVMPLGPEFVAASDEQKELMLRRLLLCRVPTWAYLARWIEEHYSVPRRQRVGFAALQNLVKSAEPSVRESLQVSGRLELAEEWARIRKSVGLD